MKKKLLAIILVIALTLGATLTLSACDLFGKKTTGNTDSTEPESISPDLDAALNQETVKRNAENFKLTITENAKLTSTLISTDKGFYQCGYGDEYYVEYASDGNGFYLYRRGDDGVWTKAFNGSISVEYIRWTYFEGPFKVSGLYGFAQGQLTADDFTEQSDGWYTMKGTTLAKIGGSGTYSIRISGDKIVACKLYQAAGSVVKTSQYTYAYGGQTITFPTVD